MKKLTSTVAVWGHDTTRPSTGTGSGDKYGYYVCRHLAAVDLILVLFGELQTHAIRVADEDEAH